MVFEYLLHISELSQWVQEKRLSLDNIFEVIACTFHLFSEKVNHINFVCLDDYQIFLNITKKNFEIY